MTKRKQTEVRTIGKAEFDLSKYERVTTAAGHSSLDCGDDVAKQLRGLDLDRVYAAAARALKAAGKMDGTARAIEKELRGKYGKLNAGMQRMNLSNRIRGAQS